ncbi:hypothetical protein [Cohnella sp. AR92]|uniref:hypothetical protein n=1 Tax=Cohnella sp. AR92 TaxID=648716 RepID=UPI000F8C4E8A|nr:hypothetical protein [Cohnella sp. AR92]RUS47684.1 hypothetical protein ELR57_07835 [Cohnella sp. AR92]
MFQFMHRARKYIIGAVAGIALTFAFQAGASNLLTGSKVVATKDVTLNGKTIGQAAIINNYSYLPVRATAEALGLKIDLTGGSINLNSVQQTSQSLTEEQIKSRISEIAKQLTDNATLKQQTEEQIAYYTNRTDGEKYLAPLQSTLDYVNELIEKLTTERSDLESQLQSLQNQ